MTHPALSPTWIHRAACRDTDPTVHDAETGEAGRQARRICAGCQVRRECLTADLRTTDAPAGIRAGLDEDDREVVYRRHGEYRQAVAVWHGVLLEVAGRREARGEVDGGLALRTLAQALEVAADAVTGYALTIAASAEPALAVAAHQAQQSAIVAMIRAEHAAGTTGEDDTVMRARMRLITAAERVSTPAPAAAPALVARPLAGAA